MCDAWQKIYSVPFDNVFQIKVCRRYSPFFASQDVQKGNNLAGWEMIWRAVIEIKDRCTITDPLHHWERMGKASGVAKFFNAQYSVHFEGGHKC